MILMRLCMPDDPGMLAAVAATLSEARADFVTIDVVHRADGVVVDNLCLELDPSATVTAMRRRVESVAGVSVEVVRHVEAPPSSVDALELAGALTADGGDAIRILVDGLPRALNAEWAMALELDDEEEVCILHTSARAPAPPTGTVPWLPLATPRRLAVAPWMPTSWRLRSLVAGGLEIAACPLVTARQAVAVARDNGRFRPPEIRQLAILSQLAVRESGRRARVVAVG